MGRLEISLLLFATACGGMDTAEEKDASAFDAIHRAGLRRFRPILLTTLTTFGGLAPIILETSNQANHLIPMAISLGFGIVFATSLLLLMVPCLYLILEDVASLGAAAD